jgi:hypothetical protein
LTRNSCGSILSENLRAFWNGTVRCSGCWREKPSDDGGDGMERLVGRILAATALVLTGLTLILAVPTAYEGPSLLYINEQHAIRLVDALGLILAVPAWLYLNVLVVRLWARRRCGSAEYAGKE